MFRTRFTALILAAVVIFACILISVSRQIVRESTSNSPEDVAQSNKKLPDSRNAGAEKLLSDVPRVQLSKGKVLVYNLTGVFDVKFAFSFQSENEKTTFRLGINNIDAVLELKVLDKLDDFFLICLAIQRAKGEVIVAGGEEKALHTPFEIKDYYQESVYLPESVLFLVSSQGLVKEILIDNSFNEIEWIRADYHDYLQNVLDLVQLFPPLPPDWSLKNYPTEINLFNVIAFEYLFSATKMNNRKYLIKGTPRKFTRFLGFPVPDHQISDKRAESLIESSGLFSSDVGFYEVINHTINLEGDEEFSIKINLSLKLVSSHDVKISHAVDVHLARFTRFESFEQVSNLVSELQKKANELKKGPEPTASNLTSFLYDLNNLLSQYGIADFMTDEDREKEFQLSRKITDILLSNPGLLKELEFFVRAVSLSPRAKLEIISILSSDKVNDLPGADDLVLSILGSTKNEGVLFNGFVYLQHFRSEKIIQFLLSYDSQFDVVNQARNSSLANILRKVCDQQNLEEACRILDSFYLRVQNMQADYGNLFLPFTIDSNIVRDFIQQKWESDIDKKTALKVMLFQAYGNFQDSARFKKILENNLFQFFSEQELLNDLMKNVPIIADYKGFYKFLADKSPYASVHSAADAGLMIIESFEGK